MISRSIAIAATAVALFLACAPAQAAPWEGEREMARLHEACDHGDRSACIRFGIQIGEHREREQEWRHAHPEWWAWEH